jgi:hypothetical protein
MHAMAPESQGGLFASSTLCGATEGWRAQIPSDVTCDDCLFLRGLEVEE